MRLTFYLYLSFVISCATTKNKSDLFIKGGKETHHDHFRGVIALNVGGGACMGTVINRNTLLTAAHCVSDKDPNTLKPRWGYYENGQDTDVARTITIDDNYRGSNLASDLALLGFPNDTFEDKDIMDFDFSSPPQIGDYVMLMGYAGGNQKEYGFSRIDKIEDGTILVREFSDAEIPNQESGYAQTEGGDSGSALFKVNLDWLNIPSDATKEFIYARLSNASELELRPALRIIGITSAGSPSHGIYTPIYIDSNRKRIFNGIQINDTPYQDFSLNDVFKAELFDSHRKSWIETAQNTRIISVANEPRSCRIQSFGPFIRISRIDTDGGNHESWEEFYNLGLESVGSLKASVSRGSILYLQGVNNERTTRRGRTFWRKRTAHLFDPSSRRLRGRGEVEDFEVIFDWGCEIFVKYTREGKRYEHAITRSQSHLKGRFTIIR